MKFGDAEVSTACHSSSATSSTGSRGRPLAGVDAVFQHGGAKRAANGHNVGVGLQHLPCPFLIDALIRRLVDEAHAAAAATAEAIIAAWSISIGAELIEMLHQLARRIVDAVVPPR